MFDAVRAQMQETFDWLNELPDCMVHHLLVPRCRFELDFKAYLLHIEDNTGCFHSTPGEGVQNLFSDGSFFLIIPNMLG